MLRERKTILLERRPVRREKRAPNAMSLEMEALKLRLKAAWMSGDYAHFAMYLESGALDFLARIVVTPGMRVLDVGCGAGQIAIPAARAGALVTGVDIASNLIDDARARASAEFADVRLEEGDAEVLTYEDSSFDLVISLMGAMFAPRPERVAAELVRVCRPGGRIVMANWTPDGHFGRMLRIMDKHVPPSQLMPSPLQWGDETIVRERLHSGIAKLEITRRQYPMYYPFPPAELVEFFSMFYGPLSRALAALDAHGQDALRAELEQLWTENSRAIEGTYVESEYLEVVAIRGSTIRRIS